MAWISRFKIKKIDGKKKNEKTEANRMEKMTGASVQTSSFRTKRLSFLSDHFFPWKQARSPDFWEQQPQVGVQSNNDGAPT